MLQLADLVPPFLSSFFSFSFSQRQICNAASTTKLAVSVGTVAIAAIGALALFFS
jgi:hypothetical protein